MSKVTVVGAGNVGATCANVLVTNSVADEVVLIDIKEGLSEGKAMDIMQTANILNINTRLTGVTNDYSKTADSDVVVITSGIPRKPGMTREERRYRQVSDRERPQIFSQRYPCCNFQPDGYNDLPVIEISGLAEKPHHRYGWRFGQLSLQIFPVSGFGMQRQRSGRYGYRRSR